MPPPGMPLPPLPVPTPPTPTPSAPAAEPTPTFAGTIRVQIFTDIIATGNETAKIKPIEDKERERIESYIKKVSGVSSVTFNPIDCTFDVGYSGSFDDVGDIEKSISLTGTACETISPLEVVFRPNIVVENDTLKNALKGVSGVTVVIKSGNDFKCYCGVEIDLNAIKTAASGAGVNGSVVSHEEIKLPLAGSGNAESAKRELKTCKYVLRADVTATEAKVLCVRGRVTRALVKSIVSKFGFAEAK